VLWAIDVYCASVLFKPEMIVYDSSCKVCCGWADRWRKVVECVPNAGTCLPVDRVYYIMLDGSVLSGAAAVLEVESRLGGIGILLSFFYRRFAFVRLCMESVYIWVSRSRSCGIGDCRVK
jgi:predicted DCC family thiol-disulfide oxidoreductase YuxK